MNIKMNKKARLDSNRNSKPMTRLVMRNKAPGICILPTADRSLIAPTLRFTYIDENGADMPLCDQGGFNIHNADTEEE